MGHFLTFIGVFAVCFQAMATPSFGIFMVVKGDVKVERGAKTVSAVKVSDKVMPGDTVISGVDSRAKIVMNDRNIIFVSPQTRMKIEAYSEGADKNVELHLQEGRVLNNVQQKYDGEKNKFIIKTPTAVAGVRGTSFITSFDKVTQITNVITQVGVVTLTSLNPNGTPAAAVEIKKGETSSASANTPPETPKAVPADQIKKMEGDVTGSAPPPPPPAADPGTGKGKEKEKGKEGTKKGADAGTTPGANAPVGPKDGFRMDDKKDKSIDGVDKIGDTQTPPQPLAPPPTVVNRPPSRTLINDTVQNKNRSKVIVTPVTPTN
jgi:hypothetical protein